MSWEKQDLPPIGLVIFLDGLASLLVFALLVSLPLEKQATALEVRSQAPDHPLAEKSPPPEPRLQTAPAKELTEHMAEVEREIDGYGIADKESGRIHIPIQRAMELVVKEGFEVRK